MKNHTTVGITAEMKDPEAETAEKNRAGTIEETTGDMMIEDVIAVKSTTETHRQHVSNKKSFYLFTIV